MGDVMRWLSLFDAGSGPSTAESVVRHRALTSNSRRVLALDDDWTDGSLGGLIRFKWTF